jgi:hypothetical protein
MAPAQLRKVPTEHFKYYHATFVIVCQNWREI